MRWFTTFFRPEIKSGVYIFLYHHISLNREADKKSLGSFSAEKISTPLAVFREHLNYFASEFEIVSLNQATNLLKGGTKPAKKYAAITFDDGLQSVFQVAMPELEARRMPFTVFVNGGPILQSEMIPRIALSRLLDTPQWENLAAEFSTLLGKSFKQPSEVFEAYKNQYAPWMDPLIQKAEAGEEPMPFADLATLKTALENPLVSIGSHTYSHPVLSHLSEEEQRHEIQGCHSQLEGALNQKLFFFAYPYGGKKHFNKTSEKICQENPKLVAYSAYGGFNLHWQPTNLLRVPIGAENLEEVKKMLRKAQSS